MYVVVVKDAPTEDEEEEDKEEDKEEEEDKGRDEREPPQRSTNKTACVDTTTYYECRLYLFILTQHFLKKDQFLNSLNMKPYTSLF